MHARTIKKAAYDDLKDELSKTMTKTCDTIISGARNKEIQWLRGLGLTLEDAEDVFQEASVSLYDVMSSKRLTMKGSPEAYLHGICHNMAYKRMEELRRKADLVDDDKLDRLLALTEEEEPLQDAIDDDSCEIDYYSILSTLLERLTPRDFSIIHGYYIEGKTMEALAIENDLASAEVARTTKCRILNRMRVQATNLLSNYY